MSRWRIAALTALIFTMLCSCKSFAPSRVPNSIPVAGDGVERAEGHVKSAANLVARAAPESNATGKALLAVAQDEHKGAITELDGVKADLSQAQDERDQFEKAWHDQNAELTKIRKSWGYRLQILVTRAFWLLVVVLAFHYVGGMAALFIPGPIGAGVSIAAAAVNPLAWFQSIRDNVFFRKIAPARASATAPNPPTSTPTAA